MGEFKFSNKRGEGHSTQLWCEFEYLYIVYRKEGGNVPLSDRDTCTQWRPDPETRTWQDVPRENRC